MPTRLQECVITLDDVGNDECEMGHYAFYSYTESINVTGALKDS